MRRKFTRGYAEKAAQATRRCAGTVRRCVCPHSRMVQTPSPLMSSAALHCPAWLSGLRRALAKRLPVVTRAAGSNPAPTVLHEYEAVWVQCKGVVVDAYPETHEYTVEVLSESGETLGVVSVPKRRVYTRA